PEPDLGFIGRDETLLALDRGFDRDGILLLHAYAGSGKTTTAAEFARWYQFTGGIGDGPVLFSSFEQHKTLEQVLDQLGHTFADLLRQNRIDWSALSDIEVKRNLALQIMGQIPLLWIWDNVEPVSGFPVGAASVWSVAEQQALADFLRAARSTQARFLLTSCRDEREWLGDLPQGIAVPPMPMAERQQLAEALLSRARIPYDQSVWRPVLIYSGGNPMALTVALGQAVRDGLRSFAQVERYVQQLRAGEAAFADDGDEKRSRSLGASLRYGFHAAFDDGERAVLALLHHFQGFIDVDALVAMGNPAYDWHLLQIAGLSRERGIAILYRAGEIGLLTALGHGYYNIPPALPWFLRRLYKEVYGADRAPDSPLAPAGEGQGVRAPALHAYVQAISGLGDYYHNQYGVGNRDVIGVLSAEEANLLHARRIAMGQRWYGQIISAMQGLRNLYDQTGRRVEWRRLVAEIVPLFVDPANDGPLRGRETNTGRRPAISISRR
ncbi:MAG: ATP-binding protein, partial [Oscillochloris sp.]|nr:ATP-binding protein [Oscillochloris sp.]